MKLNYRSCWDAGMDLDGCCFPCTLLPPSLFAPVFTHSVTEESDLQLPILPKEYEDVFINVFHSLPKDSCVCEKNKLFYRFFRLLGHC